MIKRRFYNQDHGDRDDASSESTAEEEEEDKVAEEEEEEEGEEIGVAKEDKKPLSRSSGSGYESEDSSGNEVDGDSPGLLTNEEKGRPGRRHENPKDGQLNDEVDVEKNENSWSSVIDSNDPIQADLISYILKRKSVYKCKICPRILCLNEKIVKQHLKSKRHARSKKLLGEGRLKLMLNSDGEIEEEMETHSERHARILALAQEVVVPKKKDTGRQLQSCRRKKRFRNRSEKGKPEQSTENPTKRKRNAED